MVLMDKESWDAMAKDNLRQLRNFERGKQAGIMRALKLLKEDKKIKEFYNLQTKLEREIADLP